MSLKKQLSLIKPKTGQERIIVHVKPLHSAYLNKLNKDQTLHCFGNVYREDVLNNPNGKNHQNIRYFMTQGWQGIHFDSEALATK